MDKYIIDGCFSSLSNNKTTHKLISSFKNKPYLIDLKPFLSDLFYEGLIQNEGFIKEIANASIDGWILVPVPLHPTTLKKRGYNQSEILARELGKKLGLDVQNLLEKVRDIKNQTRLRAEKRRKNINGAFSIKSKTLNLNSQNIFLVDDTVSTGLTLLECARILKKAGIKRVIGLTLVRE